MDETLCFLFSILFLLIGYSVGYFMGCKDDDAKEGSGKK